MELIKPSVSCMLLMHWGVPSAGRATATWPVSFFAGIIYATVIVVCLSQHIPKGMGAAPQTSSDMAAADAKRENAGKLSGDFDAADVDAVQRKLEQQH